ncbi:MAG: MATE family efflux transporter [Sandaracinaceae bacterium]
MAQGSRQQRLLTAPIGPTLVKLCVPMMIGIAAVIFFNVVDTFWVGRLGPQALAAMGFTFPVVMVITNLTIGISIGATAVIARAIGEGQDDRVRRLTTDSLVLAFLIVVTVSGIGLATIDPLFSALGAEASTRALIAEYMVPLYAGIGLIVVPMVGNGAIRATGDTKSPAVVMIAAGLVNAVIDPAFIFGFGPIPAMGLRGAALATILSYVVAVIGGLYILGAREKMLSFEIPSGSAVLASWKAILHIGIPAAGTNLLTPLAAGAVTRIVASHGPDAVAAYGVGTRVEGLSMIGVFAMTAALTPFVGQNHGAKNGPRIKGALSFVTKASILWGLSVALILAVIADPIARIFNDDAEVVRSTVAYLRLVPLSYAPYGVALLVASFFNALNMPLKSTALAALRLLVFAIPLAWIGSELYGLEGVFLGIAAANLTMGAIAGLYARKELATLARELPGETAAAE